MIIYKNLEEIELVKKSALLVSKTLGELKKYILPGTLPIDLDKIAETFIRDHGGEPGFLINEAAELSTHANAAAVLVAPGGVEKRFWPTALLQESITAQRFQLLMRDCHFHQRILDF